MRRRRRRDPYGIQAMIMYVLAGMVTGAAVGIALAGVLAVTQWVRR